eukprot:359252-Chlamydomonas_euryale.AAC.9
MRTRSLQGDLAGSSGCAARAGSEFRAGRSGRPLSSRLNTDAAAAAAGGTCYMHGVATSMQHAWRWSARAPRPRSGGRSYVATHAMVFARLPCSQSSAVHAIRLARSLFNIQGWAM